MSRVRFYLGVSTVSTDVMRELRQILSTPLSDLHRQIATQDAIFEAELFFNDHADIAFILRSLIRVSTSHALKGFATEGGIELGAQITLTTLENILDEHNRMLGDILMGDDPN